jgi:hypothetical protein
VADLRARHFDGGWTEIWGHATYGDVRVDVSGTSKDGSQVHIGGPTSLTGMANRSDDYQTGWSRGDVDFGALERFWLVRTSHFDEVDARTPLPGMTTVIDGETYGVTDTCGTVSLAGERQLQLIWLGNGEPSGSDWVRDGYGYWTTLVQRNLVDEVCTVEWTAIWRDTTVTVTAVHNGKAHISVASGGVPEFNAPEVEYTVSRRNCWSAVVPLAELSVRSWMSEEHEVGAGVLSGIVGFVRGRTTVVIRPRLRAHAAAEIVAVKARGQTVTPDFILHARTDAHTPPVEWQAALQASDITDLRLISSTVEWNGQVTPVDGASQENDTVYTPDLDRTSTPRPETSRLVSAAAPATLDDLPDRALSMAGQYYYRLHRFG